MGLGIYGKILNRSRETLPGYELSIPELHGTVQDIVEAIMEPMDRIFRKSHPPHI